MTQVTAGKTDAAINEAEIISTYKLMRTDLNRMTMKIQELEGEREEHRLVIETLEPLDKNRKSFRLMNGVLVERTIGELLPTLKQNYTNIGLILERLLQTFQEKTKEINAYQQKHNLRVKNEAQLTES